MSDVYIDSTLTTGLNDGTSWANAYRNGNNTDWTSAVTDASALGDIIYVAHDNQTVTNGNLVLSANTNHTADDPLRVLVATRGTTTPVDDYGAAGNGEITGVANVDYISFRNNFYMRCLRVDQGDGTGTNYFPNNGNKQTYEKCWLGCTRTGAEPIGVSSGSLVWTNVDVEFTGSDHFMNLDADGCNFLWIGGTYTHTGRATPSQLFRLSSGHQYNVLMAGIDMSGSNNPTEIINMNGALEGANVRLVGCKYPSNYTLTSTARYKNIPAFGKILDVPLNPPRAIAHHAYHGDVKHNTTIYRNTGANDGDSDYSLDFDVNGAGRPDYSAYVHELATVNAGDLSGKTIKIHFAQNSVALLNTDEIWADVITNAAVTTSRVKPGSGSPHTDESASEDWRDGAGPLTGYNEQSISVSGFGATGGAAVVMLHCSLDFSTNNLYVCPKIEII